MKFHPLILVACWIAISGSRLSAQSIPPWKVGDGWHVVVEYFPSQDKQDKDKDKQEVHRYDMHIVVLGEQKYDGVKCWNVDFLLPAKPLPAGLTGRYRVCVDLEDGWPRKAFSYRNYIPLPIYKFDNARIWTSIQDGYPVEIFPAADLHEVKGNAKSPHTLTVTNNRETGVRTATFKIGDEKEIEIRQTWKEGEKWWHEYERYRKGKLDLRAKLVPRVVVAKAPDKSPEVKPKPKETAKEPAVRAKVSPIKIVDQTHNPLRLDSRLQGTISLNMADPTVQDILDRFDKATKLSFTTEEDADTSTPVFASINWVNVPVWSAMDQLATSSRIKGRWEKTEAGYRLDGVPHSLNAPPPRNYTWFWASGGVLLALAAAGGAFVIYRRRGNNVAQAAAPALKKKPT